MNAHTHEGVDPSLLSAPPVDAWHWWQEALAGRPQPFKGLAPQQGFYRYRPRMSDRGSPAAIWFDDGQWLALVDGQPVADVAHVWRFGAKFPITETLYHRVNEGGLWPDEQPATDGTPPAGHNTATSEEVALDAVRQADEAFRAMLKEWGGAVSNEEQDAAAAGYKERLATARIEADKAREAEKKPHLDAGRAVDKKWNAVRDAAMAAEDVISKAVTAYRVERKRLADIAEAKERADRDALRAQQSAAAAAAVAVGAPPPPAPVFTAPRTARRASGLTPVKEVVFDDMGATVAWILAMKPVPTDFVEAVKAIANRRFIHGEVPGARIETTYKGR